MHCTLYTPTYTRRSSVSLMIDMSVHIVLLLCHHRCQRNYYFNWGTRSPSSSVNLLYFTAWVMLSLSVSLCFRRAMLWVPWRRCAVSWCTTWARTPRGCWRGNHRPGEKAQLIDRFKKWEHLLPSFHNQMRGPWAFLFASSHLIYLYHLDSSLPFLLSHVFLTPVFSFLCISRAISHENLATL